jgi:hypothetical protein
MTAQHCTCSTPNKLIIDWFIITKKTAPAAHSH